MDKIKAIKNLSKAEYLKEAMIYNLLDERQNNDFEITLDVIESIIYEYDCSDYLGYVRLSEIYVDYRSRNLNISFEDYMMSYNE